MTRYRWLNDQGTAVYVGRDNARLRGQRCKCLIFPRPGAIGNVLVEFQSGERVVCPAGTLRLKKQEVPE